MAPPQIPKLGAIWNSLNQKLENSRPGAITVTGSDIPEIFVKDLALHLLNEFEETEEKLKEVHKKLQDFGNSDVPVDWRAEGFENLAGMAVLTNDELKVYLLDVLVKKVVEMKAELGEKEGELAYEDLKHESLKKLRK
ncbi:uncharacterized protein MYCFIDRAFT_198352 [Pseudocercospora fijiensis CIRAD86]|uniref:Uncharacterized protein n=1 Tax=Pseudocercospora fijiensis (strain CIRAD86) TaxID=383855 RepID=M3ARE1_PSEFD|nr:uncharacterized protein MYCFIDRAFT_198352 [Pseudocercospora fijiensis CIRAD86]EME80007.1 hypothetical protein MYCFIDRAFT_198352 [Pseudocercospora fijiensis CIRAD86]